MKAAVVIPAYQPEEVLLKIVKVLSAYGLQTIVVDDGSGAAYQRLFEELGKDSVVLHHDVNRGKGEAIRTGLRFIQENMTECPLAGVMDADGQHTPEDMSKVLACASLHSDSFVLGCRDTGRMPFRSRIGNKLTRSVFYRLYHLRISDTQTGMRAFSSAFIPDLLNVEGSRYEYEMNVLSEIAKQGIPVREVGIQTIYKDPGNSTSHFHVLRDSFRIYKKLLLFSLSSLSGFAIDYSLFTAFTLLFPKTSTFVLAANILARVISGYCNYSLNCRVVFHEKKKATTAGQYLLLCAGILMLNNLILVVLSQGLRIPVYPSKLLTEILLFFISWIIQSTLIFRKPRRRQSLPVSRKAAEG